MSADVTPDTLDERVRRFARTRDSEALFPGVRERDRLSAAREIERVVRLQLAGDGEITIDSSAQLSARAIAVAAHTTGMGPILGEWVQSGTLQARADVRDVLLAHFEHSSQRWRRMITGVLPALDALMVAGIRPVALKGLQTTTSLYAHPGARRMSDLDLLVRPSELDTANDALRSAGFVPFGQSGVSHKHEWIAVGTSPRVHSLELSDERSRWTVELHTSLNSIFYLGAIAELDALAMHRTEITIEGRQLGALCPEALFIHLACHASELDANRLLRVYELALLARRGLDAKLILQLLDITGAARFTWPALALVESLAPSSVDPRILALGYRDSTWAARHTVKRLTPAGGRIGDVGLLRTLMWAQSPTALLERVWRVIVPKRHTSTGNLTAGWRTRFHQLRTGRLSFRAPDERPSA